MKYEEIIEQIQIQRHNISLKRPIQKPVAIYMHFKLFEELMKNYKNMFDYEGGNAKCFGLLIYEVHCDDEEYIHVAI